jgi:hypothetical protein
MAPSGRTRPSLLGTVLPAQDFQRSILDALNEPEPTVQRHSGRTRLLQVTAACVGVAASATALVLLWIPPQAGPAHQPAVGEPLLQAAASPARVTAATASAVHAGAPASAAFTATDGPMVTQAARIEDMAASSPNDAAVHPRVAASPFDRLAAAAPAGAPAPAPTATKTKPARPAATAVPRRRDTEPRGGAKRTRAENGGKASSSARTASRPSATRVAKAPPTARELAARTGTESDADVEIMAALMTHMNESAAANATSADGSIADLVRHCRSLPSADAQTCQRRICQGYWGRAEACPKPRERAPSVRTAG